MLEDEEHLTTCAAQWTSKQTGADQCWWARQKPPALLDGDEGLDFDIAMGLGVVACSLVARVWTFSLANQSNPTCG